MNIKNFFKKTFIICLIFLSILGDLSIIVAKTKDNENTSIYYNTKNNQTIDVFNIDRHVLNIADNYVKINLLNKRLEISNKDELSSELSLDEFNYIEHCVYIVNKFIDDGYVTVMDDGKMYLTSEIMTRGGKINRSEVKYWGIRRYNNQANTKKAADQLIKDGKNFKKVSDVPDSILNIIGLGTVSTPVKTIIGAITGTKAVGNWMYNVGTQLRKKNNKYGTVLDISWNTSFKIWKQTNNTK